MTCIYTDASSAILLYKVALFNLVAELFDLVVSPAVLYEMTQPGYPGSKTFALDCREGRFRVQSGLFDDTAIPAYLHTGESQTIGLYLSNRDGFILIDDGKAAQWCDAHDLPFINALLVPKLLLYSGYLTARVCSQRMNALCSIGRYAKPIRDWAFDCTLKDLLSFIPEETHAPSH